MESVNIREARRRLGEIVDAAERGESVVIVRHGREVARVTPIASAGNMCLPDLSEFRKTIRCKGKSLSKTVVEARDRERFG